MVQNPFTGVDPVLASAVAVGLAAKVATLLIINRTERLEIKRRRDSLRRTGGFRGGIASLIASTEAGEMSFVVVGIGVILIAAAIGSWLDLWNI